MDSYKFCDAVLKSIIVVPSLLESRTTLLPLKNEMEKAYGLE